MFYKLHIERAPEGNTAEAPEAAHDSDPIPGWRKSVAELVLEITPDWRNPQAIQSTTRFPLDRHQFSQIERATGDWIVGESSTVIEGFPAPDANPGGPTPIGVLRQFSTRPISTVEAIRLGRLKCVDGVSQLIAEADLKAGKLKDPHLKATGVANEILDEIRRSVRNLKKSMTERAA